jgi:uncharacterized protein
MITSMRKLALHNAVLRSKIRLVVQARVVGSIRDIGAEAWNACFPDELEDFHYLLAVEDAGIKGFTWRYVIVEEYGQVIAAMPAFLTDYHLDTTLDEGALRRALRRLRTYFPRVLTMKLACLGSPCAETGLIGFHPDVPESRKAELLGQLLSGFEHYAYRHGCKLFGIKDVPAAFTQKFDLVFQERKYKALPGMPTAWLVTDFSSLDEYIERLSYRTRKDMRRKVKSFSQVRMETRTNIDDVLPQVMALYRNTYARSEWQFEELTADYFTGVLANMPGRSYCTLYYRGEQLLAVNFLIHGNQTLIDKFFCMNNAEGRKYNLYFLSWFTNLRYCLEHGLTRYQSGQALYHDKLRLGSSLTRNSMYFKHRNPVVQGLLRLIAPLFGMDETSKEDR